MQLNSHLIAKTTGKAPESQCIKGENYRLTVLTDSLIRVETGVFTDEATQAVWFRSFAEPAFTRAEYSRGITVTTDKITLFFNTSSLKAESVKFKGSDKPVKCNNAGNLKGTARTLDFTFGAIPLKNGIMSRTGVAVLDDSASLILTADGMLKTREGEGKDLYVFAYGSEYERCLKDFFRLTGPVPLIPRYALGNWWSRYRAYTEREYTGLMETFINKDIPISVATIDMDWHWVDVKGKFGDRYKGRIFNGSGWTGYSWNTDLFPDYKGFLKWLQERNMKVTVNLHPADGIRDFEDMYQEMAKAVDVDPASGKTVEFNMTDPAFTNAYFKVLHRPYERDGVDFWWIDWQQGKRSAIPGLDPLWLLNHYHFLDNAGTKRPLILSRYAGPGSHRYPLGFSGDTAMNWRVFKFQPYFTVNAANIGYTWWSHDIGGHHFGQRDEELYIRWIQFGVFSPILRLHSTSNDLFGKEPWFYSRETELMAKEQMRLRHSLIPYIYTMNRRTHADGIPLLEPMYYRHPLEEVAYKVRNEYYFGSEFIVCPITDKCNPRLSMASSDVWLPEGYWTDIFTCKRYKGGRVVRMFRGMESVPALAKEGAIIPFMDYEGNFNGNPENLRLHIYRGNSSFTLYEDGGSDNGYLEGKSAETAFSIGQKDNSITFMVGGAKGDISVLPALRNYILCFKDIVSTSVVSAKVNGKPYAAEFKNGAVTLSNLSPADTAEITLAGLTYPVELTEKERLIRLYSRYQGSNVIKTIKYNKVKNLPDGVRAKSLSLPKVIREALKEE